MPCPRAHKAHRRSFPLSSTLPPLPPLLPLLPLLAALFAAAGQAGAQEAGRGATARRQVGYAVPTPLIEALSPRGLRVAIPDAVGISLVRFHVGVNRPLSAQGLGTINVEVSRPTGTVWAYDDRSTVLAAGDVLYYWLQVTLAGHTYERAGTHAVQGLVELYDVVGAPVQSVPLAESPTPSSSTPQPPPGPRPAVLDLHDAVGAPELSVPLAESPTTSSSSSSRPRPQLGPRRTTPHDVPQPQACSRSLTSVNGRLVCQGEVLFLEHFDELSRGLWAHDVRIAGQPDFEFTTFTQSEANTYTVNGQLVIRPTITDDVYGRDFVRTGKLRLENCTAGALESELCSRQARYGYILPPVLSGRISTRKAFSFRYGVIEVRAKLPSGDWIYPELWLLPREEAYGPGLKSGRVQLALARGNQALQHAATELGLRRLEAAVLAAAPATPASTAAGTASGSAERTEGQNKEQHGEQEVAVPFQGLEPSTSFAGPGFDAEAVREADRRPTTYHPTTTTTHKPTSTTTARSTSTTTSRSTSTTTNRPTTTTNRPTPTTHKPITTTNKPTSRPTTTTHRPTTATRRNPTTPRATASAAKSSSTRSPAVHATRSAAPAMHKAAAMSSGTRAGGSTAAGSTGPRKPSATSSPAPSTASAPRATAVQAHQPSGRAAANTEASVRAPGAPVYEHATTPSSSPFRLWGGEDALQQGVWSPRRATRSLSGYKGPLRKEVSRTELPGRPWSAGFHNYTLRWTPEAMVFSVDGVELGVVLPEMSGGVFGTVDDAPWRDGGKMAPFDREFYISLGLAVGGIHTFPEGVEGPNQYRKPWKNTAAKAMLSFWNAQTDWYQTWSTDSALLVDFVQVTAL